MCKFKSGIILKDRVFIPDYDSHSDMLEELKIWDTKQNAERLFVRAELIPENDDPFSPIEKWKYRVDQDILPDWYVAEVDEARMREAVKEWAKARILVGKEIDAINRGAGYCIKDCKIGSVYGSAKIDSVSGSARIGDVFGSANIGSVYDYSIVAGNIQRIGKIEDLAVVIDYDEKKIYHAGNMECEAVKK